jgi:glutamate synthase (NADPH/NADH) small chain
MLRETHAHKEGGELRWSVTTEKFSGHGGVLKKLHCAEVEWKKHDEESCTVPVKRAGSDFEVDADMVILAAGFVGPGRNRFVEELEIELDKSGNVKADEGHMTSVGGLFVAGDMRQGQSLIVRAIADGRKAAHGIMKYLRKK